MVNKAAEECGKKKVKGLIIISAGFKEIGGEGVEREEELIKICLKYNMRILGPNCLGLIGLNYNGSFAAETPKKGEIAMISQSGAMLTGMMDYSMTQAFGFSCNISLGNKADLGAVDFIEYLANDDNTKVILCYLESIKDGERFIIEAKGRKTNINGAKDEIHAQKNSYPDLVKYGVVSHIPRNGEPSRLFVTDPEVELPPADRDYKIISILNHYSKIARLGGFYRLSEKLNDRIDDIIEANGVTGQFNHVSLDYGNVFKLGRAIEFSFPDMAFSSFFSPNMEVGFKTILKNNKMLVFGMDRKVIELLEGMNHRHHYKIIVGGAPTSSAWAKEISADAWAETAQDAVQVAIELLKDKTKND